MKKRKLPIVPAEERFQLNEGSQKTNQKHVTSSKPKIGAAPQPIPNRVKCLCKDGKRLNWWSQSWNDCPFCNGTGYK